MGDGEGLSFCHRKAMKTGRGENAYTRFPLRSECFYRRKGEGHSRMRDIQPVEKDGEKSTVDTR
jgi:hypothetical protein